MRLHHYFILLCLFFTNLLNPVFATSNEELEKKIQLLEKRISNLENDKNKNNQLKTDDYQGRTVNENPYQKDHPNNTKETQSIDTKELQKNIEIIKKSQAEQDKLLNELDD